MYSRGQVSRMFGINESTLRFYERLGIIVPGRAKNGANDRRAYTDDNLEQLHRLVILKEYGLDLDTIKQILDGEIDLFDALDVQLEELKREENRIRNLILFLKFIQTTDSDLIYGLEFGPRDIDIFADAFRESAMYKDAMERIHSYNEEELEKIFEELDDIVYDFVTLDAEIGFADVERAIDTFCAWWNKHIVSMDDAGYLGFWAIFEDDSVIVSEVEEVGGETASSALQMHAFYVWMKRLMIDAAPLIKSVAANADSDIVAALEDASKLAEQFSEKLIGQKDTGGSYGYVIDYMIAILEDAELAEYLGLDGNVGFDLSDLKKAKSIFDVMTPDGDAVLSDAGVMEPEGDMMLSDGDVMAPGVEARSPDVDATLPVVDATSPGVEAMLPGVDAKSPGAGEK